MYFIRGRRSMFLLVTGPVISLQFCDKRSLCVAENSGNSLWVAGTPSFFTERPDPTEPTDPCSKVRVTPTPRAPRGAAQGRTGPRERPTTTARVAAREAHSPGVYFRVTERFGWLCPPSGS